MIARVRLVSGLILFTFTLCHLLNHVAGLGSVAAMMAAKPWLTGPWQFGPVGLVLAWALLAHWGIALWSLYQRRSLRLRGWEWAQLLLGLVFPLLMVPHLIGLIWGRHLYDLDQDYQSVMATYWLSDPVFGVVQVAAMLVGWLHGCLGLHYWLRLKPAYEPWRPWLGTGAIMVPTLALAGFIAAGLDLREALQLTPTRLGEIFAQAGLTTDIATTLKGAMLNSALAVAVVNIMPFAARWLRDSGLARKRRPVITLPDQRSFRSMPGASVLEVLRNNGVAIASVCGGRGRCTTCRVQVVDGAHGLPAPEGVEARALGRIHAPPGLRLACQIHPMSDLTILPLLPPTATAAEGRRPGGLEGREQRVTALFVDLRGSTRLGETKLPYDVLFILNQFFAEMTQAIHATRGHYAQFNGDGLLALYGLNGSPEEGARDAVRGAAAMLARLDKLNETLHSELPSPLRVGIGVHAGEAIVGAMGPPRALTVTAIGDTINTAARLESLTKEHGVSVILSEDVVRWAGLRLDDVPVHSTQVRGRHQHIRYFAMEAPPAVAA